MVNETRKAISVSWYLVLVSLITSTSFFILTSILLLSTRSVEFGIFIFISMIFIATNLGGAYFIARWVCGIEIERMVKTVAKRAGGYFGILVGLFLGIQFVTGVWIFIFVIFGHTVFRFLGVEMGAAIAHRLNTYFIVPESEAVVISSPPRFSHILWFSWIMIIPLLLLVISLIIQFSGIADPEAFEGMQSIRYVVIFASIIFLAMPWVLTKRMRALISPNLQFFGQPPEYSSLYWVHFSAWLRFYLDSLCFYSLVVYSNMVSSLFYRSSIF